MVNICADGSALVLPEAYGLSICRNPAQPASTRSKAVDKMRYISYNTIDNYLWRVNDVSNRIL